MAGKGILSRSHEETRRMGARLARALPAGTVVALVGELGAGKTVLVQGAAEGLGVGAAASQPAAGERDARGEVDKDGGDVISPSFVLVREHVGSDGRTLVHADAHRLADAGEFAELGIEDALGRSTLAFVEWADKVIDALPEPWLLVRISHEGENLRRFELGGAGETSEELIRLARAALLAEAAEPGGGDGDARS